MITLDCEQGSDEWFEARVGIPSASVFSKIFTSEGKVSKSGAALMNKLVGERLTGKKAHGYSDKNMEGGSEREDEARIFFQMMTGLEVEQVGLCYYDEKKDRSCSPDGLIGDNEGLEIKCPIISTQIEYLRKGSLPTNYFSQVQGSLYITGRERWHFMSYYPGIKPLHLIIERDEIWIAKFSKILADFIKELDETHKMLIDHT